MKKKKQTLFYMSLLLIGLSSCGTSIKQIGKLNMISNRNVDKSVNYALIATYAGGSPKELKKSRALTIEEALDKTVKKIPGGEYLMNAKLYLIKGEYFAIEGDVWGHADVSYRGFRKGDKVTWREAKIGAWKKGVIKSLNDDETCIIETEDGEIVKKSYNHISKAE